MRAEPRVFFEKMIFFCSEIFLNEKVNTKYNKFKSYVKNF